MKLIAAQVSLLGWLLLTTQIVENGVRETQAFSLQLPQSTYAYLHRHTCSMKMSPNDVNNNDEKEFKLGKPIDLPSLREPKDAGPMFATCRSVSGVEPPVSEDEATNKVLGKGEEESDEFIPNKPIELESLRRQEQATFLGLTPKDDDLRRRDGSLNVAESGLPLFTSTIVFGMTWYLIYIALFTDYVP